MEEFLARKYKWIDAKTYPFFTVLVNCVGHLVKTVTERNGKNYGTNNTILRPYNGMESRTSFFRILYIFAS